MLETDRPFIANKTIITNEKPALLEVFMIM